MTLRLASLDPNKRSAKTPLPAVLPFGPLPGLATGNPTGNPAGIVANQAMPPRMPGSALTPRIGSGPASDLPLFRRIGGDVGSAPRARSAGRKRWEAMPIAATTTGAFNAGTVTTRTAQPVRRSG